MENIAYCLVSCPIVVVSRQPQIRREPTMAVINGTILINQPDSRQTFIQSSVRLALDNQYDGIGLHWLFPNTTEEMANLGTFLIEWRHYLSLSTNCSPLLVKGFVVLEISHSGYK
jgi:hypothetical protein